MTTGMVLKPQSPGSIVATNIHADILSNHAGALAGSLGVAPTMNIEPDIMDHLQERAGGAQYARSVRNVAYDGHPSPVASSLGVSAFSPSSSAK
jgi:isocitrate/isopropylmalate dehydrogenase